ncbi:glycosyltransferase SypP [Vibrio variabilis]|uniref:Glycosyltransferase SypP n=1 Tax=Vibrio variabilis TaxID=990271 RepID=A0ABQ0JA39_9VIBR|nr:glycosyltransferase SypP [Vibrio variabilis]
MSKSDGLQLSLFNQIKHELNRLNANVVHTHHIGPLIYGGLAAKLSRARTRIHTEHDMWHLQNSKRRLIEKLALKVVNPILVADADEVSKQLNEMFPFTHSTVIKNGVDCNRFVPSNRAAARRILGLPNDTIVIGTAGRLVPVKSHTTLIKQSLICQITHTSRLLVLDRSKTN